jgi:hypothetical protein
MPYLGRETFVREGRAPRIAEPRKWKELQKTDLATLAEFHGFLKTLLKQTTAHISHRNFSHVTNMK